VKDALQGDSPMHFKLRYVIDGMRVDAVPDEGLNFPYGGERRVLVRILHAIDEHNPAVKILVCEGLSEQKVEDSTESAFQRFSAGVPLDTTQRSFFKDILSGLLDCMQKTVMTLRWRCSIVDGPTTTFRNGKEAYSFDGTVWQEEPKRVASLKMLFGHPYPTGISEKQCEEIVALVEQGASEPLEGQLVREAWNLREQYPKAALVIGVAGAEIGFRRLVDKIGSREGITKLVKKYWRHPDPIPTITGIQIKASDVLRDSLLVGIQARNDVVHKGAAAPGPDELRDILWNIGQLLWIWDFYSGHAWALEHLSPNSVSKTRELSTAAPRARSASVRPHSS
jgi:hypothetical protein